ncbi:hypothetical protein AAFC00_004953 [Neodothiora populina]
MTPVTATPSSTVPSPSYQYPTGPPPPYSHPTSQNSHSAPHTPPDARRSSGDDVHAKQSLPSIHEALGVEQPRSFPSQPSYSSAPQQAYAAPAPPSPPISRKSFAMEPPPLPAHPASHASSYSAARRSPNPQYPPEVSPRTAQDHFERVRPPYMAAPPPPVVTASRNEYSPVPLPNSYPQPFQAADPSPAAERTSQHALSMPPPPPPSAPAPFSFGYSSYQQHRPAYTAPYAAPSSGSIYQPSVSQPAPAHPITTRPNLADPDRVYGESVKRHLDMYDFEAALNEIADGSSRTLDFSRQLGAKMHQAQRSGPIAGTLPSLHEIDDMMARSRNTLDCLGRMRETVVAQEAAYCYAQEQHQYKSQDESKRDSVHDESKLGGFAGPEAKKRRGRAAPPGRCHSCQRAETPEWRRGPDGARTLCNACGLHYAKLTRKQGTQKAAMGGSSLRPKAGSSEQPDASN